MNQEKSPRKVDHHHLQDGWKVTTNIIQPTISIATNSKASPSIMFPGADYQLPQFQSSVPPWQRHPSNITPTTCKSFHPALKPSQASIRLLHLQYEVILLLHSHLKPAFKSKIPQLTAGQFHPALELPQSTKIRLFVCVGPVATCNQCVCQEASLRSATSPSIQCLGMRFQSSSSFSRISVHPIVLPMIYHQSVLP